MRARRSLDPLARVSAQYASLGLVLIALFATIALAGHAGVQQPTTGHQNSLLLTINPDKSVVIDWNTTTYSSQLQNISRFFPSGYAFQSSTTFSQQGNAVIETTKALYQLPIGFQYLSMFSPIRHINIVHSSSSNRVSVNASAQVYFSSTLYQDRKSVV